MSVGEGDAVPEVFSGWPFWALYAFFFVGAMARGQALYWLARYLTQAGLRNAPTHGWRGRMARWLDDAAVDHASNVLRRIGLVLVPLCYLTVGFQSAVLAAAGILRIGAVRFTLATVPGALAWAAIYTTIGFAVWGATIQALAGSPWALLALVVLAVALVLAIRGRRGRRDRRILRDAAAGDDRTDAPTDRATSRVRGR